MRGKNRLDRVSRDINERMNMMRVMTGDDDDDDDNDDDKEVGSAGADTKLSNSMVHANIEWYANPRNMTIGKIHGDANDDIMSAVTILKDMMLATSGKDDARLAADSDDGYGNGMRGQADVRNPWGQKR